uniref:uncharacterized protein LOC120326310 n=1 Tax=Styela clava TaxID=7725 RepID=UPI001939E54A|nr:uncharacterized protein LOC120326310 [Styela clava]
MRGFAFTAVVGCIMLFVSGNHGQSTSTQPPGYYAGYLNRYTKEDQCVYSFVVPKKDRDQCPGLKSTVEAMSDKIKDLERRQTEMTAVLSVLQENKQSWHKIGELEAHVRQLEQERTTLVADAQRLQAEKDAEENKRLQLTVELEDARSQLQGIQAKYVPLQGNYTKLLDDFNRVREEMEKLQTDYDKLQSGVKTLRSAKNCSAISKHLPSCAAIKRMGYKKSGYSMIDPDGEGGVEPFLVYCDMDSDPTTGISVVQHTHTPNTAVVGCEKPGCLSQPIDYKGVSMDQIAKLIEISTACEQFLRYDCYDSKLLKDGTGWWVSRQGKRMYYWGGATPGSNMCACGETGSCADKNEVCNCDADSEAWLYDQGFLKDKNVLPVSQINFGDVSEDNGERGKSTVGPLYCKWDVGYPVPSCEALQKSGVTKSGNYMILQDEGKDPIEMRCQMTTAIAGGVNNNIILDNKAKNDTRAEQRGTAVALQPHGNMNLYIFTDCGQTHGRFGPTEQMCNHTYKNTNLKVTVKDGTQFWIVPKSGRYKIEAKGPAGQQHLQHTAGRGATVSGEFDLKQDNVVKVLVGQKGSRIPDLPYYGGSGATFVVKFVDWVDQPLVVAGGGGCSATRTAPARLKITDASASTDGKDGSEVGINYGHGGKDGQGGERGGKAAGRNTPGGGAGFMHDGTESGDSRWGVVEPSKAFTSHGSGVEAPGVGGTFEDSKGNTLDGGFGGGGSAASYASGGAGGYSGGGGGPDEGYSGGGGSFADAQQGRSLSVGVNNIGPGIVKIEYLGPLTN